MSGGGTAMAEGVIENDRGTGRFTGRADSLTSQQNAFVAEMVANGGKPTESARRAGYAFPSQDAYKLMRNPAVLSAIRHEQQRAITSGASVAWGTMMDLMTGADVPAPVRFSAAKWTLEASGHGLAAQALAAKGTDPDSKPMSEMTVAELEEHVKRMGAAVETMKQAEGKVLEVSNEDGSAGN
jgi:hypothetical protein